MQKNHSQRGVINLILVLGVGVFGVGGALLVATEVLTELVNTQKNVFGDQAYYTAEAELSEGTYQYVNNTLYAGGLAPLLNGVSTGEIEVTVLTWPLIEVRGTGQQRTNFRDVTRVITLFPEGLAFDYAAFGFYDLNFIGSANVTGNVFANNSINFTGNKAEVDGDAYSAGTIDDGTVTGETYEGVQEVPAPQVDEDGLRTRAITEGTYFDNAAAAEAYLNNPAENAVVFIDVEDINLQNINLTGALVTAGNLRLSGGATITRGEDLPALVVLGDLTIVGDATIYGIVYVKGNTSFSGGNVTIEGTLIASGENSIGDITGNVMVNYNPLYIPDLADLDGIFETESTAPPRIIGWIEK